MIPSGRAEGRARMKVLLSAYACEPRAGSEPGVGWNTAAALAGYHEIWVLTRANNRAAIEQELAGASGTIARLRFAYYDLPRWAGWWKRGKRGVHLYYYLWQVGAYFTARRLHREIGFDLTHHVTFGKYWVPSLLALLPVPFVWGPVGGAESAPKAFWGQFSLSGKVYEGLRDVGRWLGEHDHFVRLTARRSVLALAKTETTAERLRRLGAGNVRVLSDAGLPLAEMDDLARRSAADDHPVRFISIGNLLELKGFHLGLRAFARGNLEDAEYWIVGDGPARQRLESLAERLGCAARIKFWGRLPRDETLRRLAESHVLVHPSLHDSGGWVCVEAMTMGRPVVCFDLGGPGTQVAEEAGVKVQARYPDQAVRDLAEAMCRLARDAQLRQRMGEAGRLRSRAAYQWEGKGEFLNTMYHRVLTHSTDQTQGIRGVLHGRS
jgi:glycosyltransferase involved in cell wall biosynthesis